MDKAELTAQAHAHIECIHQAFTHDEPRAVASPAIALAKIGIACLISIAASLEKIAERP